jgi:hypothetical protein
LARLSETLVLKPLGRVDIRCFVSSAFWRLAIGFMVCVSIALHAGPGLAKEKASSLASASAEPAVSPGDLTEEQIQFEMKKYLGIPYRRGGSTRKGTDCSGLIRQIYGKLLGLDLPHNAAAQSRLPYLEDVPKEDLKVGDLVFFGSGKGRIDHIGAYLEDGKFIHASRKYGAVTVSSLDKPYWRKRLICSRHIKGLELGRPEWGDEFDALVAEEAEEKDTHGNDTIQWNFSALEAETGAGFLNEVLLAPFFDLTVETFALWSGPQPLQSAFSDLDTGWESHGGSPELDFRQGVRLSKELALSRWLQVAPFWSYVRQQDRLANETTEEQSLGLSAEIGHPSLPWSISLAAQPPSGTQESTHPSLWETDWRELELFFGYRYHISNAWKFSLFGSGSTGSEEALSNTQAVRNGSPAVEDVTVLFDFIF